MLICKAADEGFPMCLEHLLQLAHPFLSGSLRGNWYYPYCEQDTGGLTCIKFSFPCLFLTARLCSSEVIHNPLFKLFNRAGSDPETQENTANRQHVCT